MFDYSKLTWDELLKKTKNWFNEPRVITEALKRLKQQLLPVLPNDNNLYGIQNGEWQEVVVDTTGLQEKSAKGQPNGYASLDLSGRVPSTQLPSYVDDVLEVDNLTLLPLIGESGKIYITTDTNKQYRWTGSAYVEITAVNYWTVDVNNNIQNNNSGSVFSRGGGNPTESTAFGENSLKANTTGNWNDAFGFEALSKNTTGFSNTAIGNSALLNSTVSSWNVAIGAGAMTNYNSTSTTTQNTAVGAGAMYNLTTGRRNTTIGSSTMINSTVANDCIAIGFHAMENTNGSNNISIGAQAGKNLTTGSNNIIISQGLNGGSGLSTGSGNTIIGHRTGLPANLTNHFIASDGVGTEKFRVDNNGNFAIGTTSPNSAALLDLTSTTKGFLPPRMSTIQRNAIASPPDGLIIYNITTNLLNMRQAGSWVSFNTTPA